MVAAWAATKAGLAVENIQVELPALRPFEVEIRVEACGICATDIHINRNDWGFTSFPRVSGHEIVGVVTKAGDAVRGLVPGDRVGVGAHKDSCGRCTCCLADEGPVCSKTVITCAGGEIGGFSEIIHVPSDWAFKIPEALASEHAAPLMCGGITVFHPLQKYGAPGKRVGVVGIGGLGHMAILFAKARGCTVTAFSTSATKSDLAKELGADIFVNSSDAQAMAEAADSIDLLLVTIDGPQFDMNLYLPLVTRLGTVSLLGAITTPIVITSNATGGRGRIVDMLAFAAEHKIKPIVEVFPFDQINEAMQKVESSSVRFRAVLKR